MRLFNIIKELALRIKRLENATVLKSVSYSFDQNHIAENDGYLKIYCPYATLASGRFFTVYVDGTIISQIRPDATNSTTLGGIFIKKGTTFKVTKSNDIPSAAALSFLELGGGA